MPRSKFTLLRLTSSVLQNLKSAPKFRLLFNLCRLSTDQKTLFVGYFELDLDEHRQTQSSRSMPFVLGFQKLMTARGG